MSDPSTHAARDSWSRLPEALRPREREHEGTGSLRLIETTLLVLAGLLLAIATVNDVARQTGVNERLIADIATWRAYTHHDFHNVTVDEELLRGASTHREVTCGNTAAGSPRSRPQVCLIVSGPTRGGRRRVTGGWYLPAHTEDDVRASRYGCFGEASELGMCAR